METRNDKLIAFAKEALQVLTENSDALDQHQAILDLAAGIGLLNSDGPSVWLVDVDAKPDAIQEFDLRDQGVHTADTFPGAGVAFTAYTEIVTGCGRSLFEAADNALDMLATTVDLNKNDTERLETAVREFSNDALVPDDSDEWVFVSILYNPTDRSLKSRI